MKKIIVFSLLVLLAFSFQLIQAQELTERDKKKLEKQQKKEQKEAQELAEWNESKQMAESKRFVFTADQINTGGGMIQVDPKVNFFYVDGEKATFQFAFYQATGVPNPNGMGGITTDATVTTYSFSAENPKKPISIAVTIKPLVAQGRGLHSMVVTIFGDGYAELIMPEGTTRLKGKIVTPEKSKIFKGATY